MIKINLLPKTLNQKAVLRNTALLFGALLLVLLAAGIGYSFKLQGDVNREEALAAETEAYEQRVKAIQQQTAQILAAIQPMQAKLDFINNVLKYNLEFPKLYEQVATWTYDKAVLSGLQSDGTNVTLRARVKNLDDLGRYMLNMYRATDLFTEVRVTEASGFGSRPGRPTQASQSMGYQIGGSQASLAGITAVAGGVSRTPITDPGIDFTVVAKLKNPIAAPQFSGAASSAAGGAPQPPGSPMPPEGAPAPGQPSADGLDIERQMGGNL